MILNDTRYYHINDIIHNWRPFQVRLAHDLYCWSLWSGWSQAILNPLDGLSNQHCFERASKLYHLFGTRGRKKLYLFLNDNHYDVVTSMPARKLSHRGSFMSWFVSCIHGAIKWRGHWLAIHALLLKTLTTFRHISVWLSVRCYHLVISFILFFLTVPKVNWCSPCTKTCADACNQFPCTQNDSKRAIQGTLCSIELEKALEKGYHDQVLESHEVWHFSKISDNLFANYINTFQKIKQEASGYPKSVTTEEQAEHEEYFEREGIRLHPNKIEYNPGLRALAKLMLNSFLRKYYAFKRPQPLKLNMSVFYVCRQICATHEYDESRIDYRPTSILPIPDFRRDQWPRREIFEWWNDQNPL